MVVVEARVLPLEIPVVQVVVVQQVLVEVLQLKETAMD
jgi:hypothetical protein